MIAIAIAIAAVCRASI